MFRRSRSAFAAAAVALTFAFVAQADLENAGEGKVEIHAVAKPALGKFSGELDGVTAKERDGKLVFVAELPRGLKMGMRDSHTREVFKVDKHKQVKLSVDKSKLTFPEDNKKVEGEVKGDLTLHGVTKPVTVKYVAKRTGSDYHLKGTSFSFNYTDFGVEKICKLSVCVEPQVTIRVDKLKLRQK
jgi:polyisoprenoid-binding protein YceI